MSDSVQPHRWQPTRLPHPWDSPGKNTGVGCYFLLQCMKVKRENEATHSCPTPSDPMDCSLPGSSVHGIFQARVLEWVATETHPISATRFTISSKLLIHLSSCLLDHHRCHRDSSNASIQDRTASVPPILLFLTVVPTSAFALLSSQVPELWSWFLQKWAILTCLLRMIEQGVT